jgi:hypothetical protein
VRVNLTTTRKKNQQTRCTNFKHWRPHDFKQANY